MAKLSSDGKYVTVEKGDTLWGIASKYLGAGNKYPQLVKINKNIKNPNLIYVGQKIYLTSTGSSSSTSSTTTNSNQVTIDQFGVSAVDETLLFATWSWGKDNTESYKILWTYDTGDGVWFVGNNGSNTVDKDMPEISRQSTYNIPAGAKKVRFKVKPISKKKKKNNKETDYWTAEWSTVKTWTDSTPLDTPSVPDVEIEDLTLTASLTGIDITGAEGVQFQVVKIAEDNTQAVYKTGKATITLTDVVYTCSVAAGYEYKVRCRAYGANDSYSEWTEYSNSVETVPATPSGITTIRAHNETSVYLEWSEVSTADAYDIEYTTRVEYFDASAETSTITADSNKFYVTGLGYSEDTNNEYFFRVRAKNSKGESGWTDIKSVTIGEAPAAPTTWSSTTTAIVGEQLFLFWVHNAKDASRMRLADLEIYSGDTKIFYTFSDTAIDNGVIKYTPLSDSEDEITHSCELNLTYFMQSGLSKLEWRLRTAGAINEYGDWSVKRTIDIYDRPELNVSVTDADENSLETVTTFPFYIYCLPVYKTDAKYQYPIGYHVSITANETYETVDNMGNEIVISKGDSVYSKYVDESMGSLLLELSANSVNLENNVEYTVTAIVSMSSGLTGTNSTNFVVSWADVKHQPNAEISLDEDTLTAYIRPYCEDSTLVNRRVTESNGVYTLTDEEIECDRRYAEIQGETEDDVRLEAIPSPGTTTTGEVVYEGVVLDAETGNVVETLYYSEVAKAIPVYDVWLSVYRREFDGSFTELATQLDGALTTTVTDPHPALDLARYRIVATTKDTGAVSYYDVPGYPVGGVAAVIQWDEVWSNFETTEEDALEQPAWSGSMLKLPYNIDVSDSNSPDVVLVEYMGREHPVGYYGTHLGSKSNWSMSVEKSDKETIYALRRLQRWMGDVYVREPSGSGYWANITVSFSQKHCDLIVPVTLSITRVEGGA